MFTSYTAHNGLPITAYIYFIVYHISILKDSDIQGYTCHKPAIKVNRFASVNHYKKTSIQ